jgi:hypothetical protein
MAIISKDELKTRKWGAYEQHDFCSKTKHKSLEGFSSSSNVFHNHITIFCEKQPQELGYSRPPIYTLSIACDEHGETGGEYKLSGLDRKGKVSNKLIEAEAMAIIATNIKTDFYE